MKSLPSLPSFFTELFRPCIDIHKGWVKQIIGSTLTDTIKENFVAIDDIETFADNYAKYKLSGGHIIMLDRGEATIEAAKKVVRKYPGVYQVGGGMDPTDLSKGEDWLSCGAQKIIISSYLFLNGFFYESRLDEAARTWGREHLVVDLSSIEIDGKYRAAIHGWKTITDFVLSPQSLKRVGDYCGEILIHGIAQEGKRDGIDDKLFSLLESVGDTCPVPLVYAGGIHSLDEVKMICERSYRIGGKIGFTIGSSLDIFGGNIPLEEVLNITRSYRL